MAIRIFVTGGTFDKKYDPLQGQLVFDKTHVPETLIEGKSKILTHVEPLMMKDSLEMDDEDRKLILDACNHASEKMILITHGTDTMAETAKVLGEARLDKTIILTGAMIPYVFGSSDGLFNLGSALAFCQSLPRDVYIAMNGEYFCWDNVRKNRNVGAFERIRSNK